MEKLQRVIPLKKISIPCAAAGGWLWWMIIMALICPAPVFGEMPRLSDFPVEEGYVDWEGGFIYAYGSGPFPDTVTRMAEGRQMTLKSAWRAARIKLSKMTASLLYNSERRIVELLKEDSRSQKGHRRFLLEAEPVRIMARMDASMAMWIRAPLYGPDGLAAVTGGGESGTEAGAGDSGSKPLLVLALVPKPGVSQRCLWPVIYRPDGSVFLDTASPGEASPTRDFAIYRISGDRTPDHLPFSSLSGERASRAVYHSNGADLVLEEEPEGMKTPDGNTYGGLVILESSE